MFGWIGHGIHEQLSIVGPILEIIEWFKVVEAVHELIKLLIEQGIRGVSWFGNPTVSRFWWRVLRFSGGRRSHPSKPGACLSRSPADSSSRILLLVLQSAYSHLNVVDEIRIYSIDPCEYIARPFLWWVQCFWVLLWFRLSKSGFCKLNASLY